MNEICANEQSSASTEDHARSDGPSDHAPARVVNSEVLMGGSMQLAIRHNQSIYFLRQTRFGKLILTK